MKLSGFTLCQLTLTCSQKHVLSGYGCLFLLKSIHELSDPAPPPHSLVLVLSYDTKWPDGMGTVVIEHLQRDLSTANWSVGTLQEESLDLRVGPEISTPHESSVTISLIFFLFSTHHLTVPYVSWFVCRSWLKIFLKITFSWLLAKLELLVTTLPRKLCGWMRPTNENSCWTC